MLLYQALSELSISLLFLTGAITQERPFTISNSYTCQLLVHPSAHGKVLYANYLFVWYKLAALLHLFLTFCVKSDARFPLGAAPRPSPPPRRDDCCLSPELPLLSASGLRLPIGYASLGR